MHALLALVFLAVARAEQTVLSGSDDRWAGLRARLGDRLVPARPFAAPCFAAQDGAPAEGAGAWKHASASAVPPVNASADACADVRAHYVDECMHGRPPRTVSWLTWEAVERSAVYAAQIQPQWEGCQRSGAQCLLDWTDSGAPAATAAPYTCSQGSVSEYYVSRPSRSVTPGLS
jgi:hypothetical protein